MACKIEVEEMDQVDQMIRKTGCWDQHMAVNECMVANGDWRQCQNQLREFKQCMLKNNAQQFIRVVQDEAKKAEIKPNEAKTS